ncbi:MAG TPA: N-6 DNA methylase [Lacunisphaera sp.]|jgi:hypothetical protein
MNLQALVEKLGYADSRSYLRRGDAAFESAPGYGHIFRRGASKPDSATNWRVEGVYCLRDSSAKPERIVPIIYVCHAADAAAASDLHKLVWNQDVVPYVLVHTPQGLRVYSGFRYSNESQDAASGVLRALVDFKQCDDLIALFHAQSIDSGRLLRQSTWQVDSKRRVYHELLADLRALDKWLREPTGGNLHKDTSHALIGKYVYLHYLRDRGILSDRRLADWDVSPPSIFGRTATREGLKAVSEQLDDFLNGEVFPLSFSGKHAPTVSHISRVAGTFAGDNFTSGGTQTHLGFKAYDFSFIPIETLSLIYEQFLHIADEKSSKPGAKTKGEEAGAYYTPLPLVNYMLAEMEAKKPLRTGMRILDPSSGSGAFLVQAYRRLIETTFPTSSANPRAKPSELKQLLETSIFGADLDGDACQVTQLGLQLTLLDYVNPPDLKGNVSRFKLPSLHNRNIFEGNFFKLAEPLRAATAGQGFDWVIGNPPWKALKEKKVSDDDRPVWDWMQQEAATAPVGMYQIAQAFAWAAPRLLKPDGECGLLVPAMGLFEEPSVGFRRAFFRHFQVHGVANFANLAEVLFDGRARVPAAALFYRQRVAAEDPSPDEPITTFSPFVVNQEATRPLETGERSKLWSLTVNGSEIRTLSLAEVATGSGLPWKLAMWGTPWDERLIKRLEKKWAPLNSLESNEALLISQGLALRGLEAEQEGDFIDEALEEVDEAKGKLYLNTDPLKKLRDIFSFPQSALVRLDRKPKFTRKGRAKLPLKICRPPHVIVSAARNFAVYSDEFIIVPDRQIGIVTLSDDEAFLKALSLFLSSDFAFYHQFIRSTQFGVQRGRATLAALRQMPVPLAHLSRAELKPWTDLHTQLVKCPPRQLHEDEDLDPTLFEDASEGSKELLIELNRLTAEALGLDARERALIHDLVQVRLALNDGKRGAPAMRSPTTSELRTYAKRLKTELDGFVGADSDRLHRVSIVHEHDSAMIEVDFTTDRRAAGEIAIFPANRDTAAALRKTRDKLLREYAQWVYFNRDLRVYRGRQTYLFKPLHRFHWTESAAMMDAGQIIAETISGVSE